MRLAGKVALITGGASGIGEATAKTLARDGCSVVVVDRAEENARRVVEEIRQSNGKAEFVTANVGAPSEIDRMVKFAVDKFGRVDILHNNAVFTVPGRVAEISLESWQKTLDVSLTGYWYASKTVLPLMVKQGGGSIVNMSSTAGLSGDYNMVTYNVAKAGVINLTRVTALDYARKGVRCNTICPGPIDTPSLRWVFRGRNGEESLRRLQDRVPMGRMGRPEEIAKVVLFLASDESSFMTGAVLSVDGGFMAHSGTPPVPGYGADW